MVFSLARLVMEKTPHVLFAGAGANRFAHEQGIVRLAEGSLVSPYAKLSLEEFKKRQSSGTEIKVNEQGNTKITLMTIFNVESR